MLLLVVSVFVKNKHPLSRRERDRERGEEG
jgi:hypothetical protein